MLLNCGVGEDSRESLGLQGDPTGSSGLGVHWKDWCWSWNSTWCEELIHLKRPWCWEKLRAAGEGNDRGWDGWMALPTRWTWVWVDSGSWWWTGRPDVLWFLGSQRARHDWATELNWTELQIINKHTKKETRKKMRTGEGLTSTPKKKGAGVLTSSVFLNLIFKLKDNCFTELCGFLSYINKNQP